MQRNFGTYLRTGQNFLYRAEMLCPRRACNHMAQCAYPRRSQHILRCGMPVAHEIDEFLIEKLLRTDRLTHAGNKANREINVSGCKTGS